MNKIKKILLLSCSLLALVSCGGGGGTSSTPASVASSSQEALYPKYTFSGTHFYVVAEYSGDNVSYVAKAKTGNYEKITDLSEAREASALISNNILVGCEYTYNGTFAFIDGKYSAAESGGQHTVTAGVSANYTYNKTENKLVLADADLEDSKAFYDKFTDVSKYQGVVSGTKLVAFSSLDDGASVTVAFPTFFYEDYEANPTSFTFDASYAVVVKNS